MSTETKPNLLLMLDDNPLGLEGLKKALNQVHGRTWRIEVYTTYQGIKDRVAELSATDLPALVSVDLGLPPDTSSPRYGLAALESLRDAFGGLRLSAHSLKIVDARVSRRLLAISVSYMLAGFRDGDFMDFAKAVPLMASGYVVFTPRIGHVLSLAIAEEPDPLDSDEWQIVSLCAQGLTYVEMGLKLERSSATIQERATKIANVLQRLGYINMTAAPTKHSPRGYPQELSDFYKTHALRFNRTENRL